MHSIPNSITIILELAIVALLALFWLLRMYHDALLKWGDGDKKSDFFNSVQIIHIGNFYASMTVITD